MSADQTASAPAAGRLKRNFALLSAAEVASRFLLLASGLVVARVLGPEVLGPVVLAQGVAIYMAALTEGGLTLWSFRQIVMDRTRLSSLVTDTATLQLIVAGVGVGIAAVVYLFDLLPHGSGLLLLLFSPFAVAIALNFKYALQARELMGAAALQKALGQFVTSAGTIALVILTNSPVWVGVMLWVGQFTADLLAVVVLRRRVGLRRVGPSARGVSEVLRHGAPLMASVALFQYALILDLIVLGLIGTPTALGLYSAPAWLVVAAYVLVQVPLQAAYPELVRRFHTSPERLTQLVATLVSLAARFTLAGAALVVVESGAIVQLLFGPEYEGSAVLLSILVLVVPLGWYAALVGYVLTVAGNFRRFLVSLVPPAVAATVAMPILISEFGTIGAAVGAAATMGLQAVCFTFTTRRHVGLAPAAAAAKEIPYGLVPLAALLGLGAVMPAAPLFVAVPVWMAALALVEVVRGLPTFHASGVIALVRGRGATSAEEGP